MKSRRHLIPLILLCSSLFALLATETRAQRVRYPPEEFAGRRAALCRAVADQGLIMLFGKTMVPPGIRFRQDNDRSQSSGRR